MTNTIHGALIAPRMV